MDEPIDLARIREATHAALVAQGLLSDAAARVHVAAQAAICRIGELTSHLYDSDNIKADVLSAVLTIEQESQHLEQYYRSVLPDREVSPTAFGQQMAVVAAADGLFVKGGDGV